MYPLRVKIKKKLMMKLYCIGPHFEGLLTDFSVNLVNTENRTPFWVFSCNFVAYF